MSGISKRTVYYDPSGGVARFWDWASVHTDIGTMAEPFIVGARHVQNTDFETVDFADEINRVDEIRAYSWDKHRSVFGDNAIGGYTGPREGQ